MTDVAVTWSDLSGADFDEVVELAAICLAADGGLPSTADPGFLRRRWEADGVVGRTGRDARGRLVAAASVRPSGEAESTITTLVHPDVRSSGAAAELLDRCLGMAPGGGVVVETESLTPEQETLFAGRGLRQVFAEDVLRIDLTGPLAAAVWPEGAVLHDWTPETAPRFFAVYEAAFRERPGFPGVPQAEWIGDLEGDDDFRPDWSLLVELPQHGDAGFVTAADAWIDQVGVLPAARGAGLGRALTSESLTRMRAAGGTEAWLNVNVDNPAKKVYLHLGFTAAGRRARFRR